jgi:hypothetical protein
MPQFSHLPVPVCGFRSGESLIYWPPESGSRSINYELRIRIRFRIRFRLRILTIYQNLRDFGKNTMCYNFDVLPKTPGGILIRQDP